MKSIRYMTAAAAFVMSLTIVAPGAEFSAPTQQLLEVVVSARARQRTVPDIRGDRALISSFNEALSALQDAPPVPGEDDEDTLERKLLKIAHDRKRRPEVYSEIISNYADRKVALQKPGVALRRAILSPNLKTQHCTETYRLVWEYFLLAPRMDYLELYDQRALEALARRKSERSLLTISRSFDLLLDGNQEMEPHYRTQQQLIMSALLAFGSEKALDTILSCLEQWKHNRTMLPKSATVPHDDSDLEKWLSSELSSKNTSALRRRWEPIVQAYSNRAAALSAEKRRSFELIKSAVSKRE